MRRGLVVIVASFQLARIGLVLTAVSNIWVVVWLSSEAGGTGLETWARLLSAAGVAVGMYVFGMTLNDLMDARRDRVMAPDRPLPSRRVRSSTALALAVAGLLVCVAGSVPMGAMNTVLCLVTATLVLFYNGPGKHIAGAGILTLGMIRALHMLIAEPGLTFLWPVWLTMTHVVGLSALCHRLEEKRPELVGPQVWVVTLGWAFVSLVMFGWAARHGGLERSGHPWLLAYPACAVGAFLLVIFHTLTHAPQLRAAGGLLMKRGLIWLIVYDVSWLAGAGLWMPAAIHAGLIPATWVLMAAVRHLKSLSESPPGFTR